MASTFRRLLALNPDDQRASARLSEALVNLNQYEEVKSFLTPLVAMKSPPLWAVLDISIADQELGDVPSAIRLLGLAEKQDPTNRSIHFRLLQLYKHTGNEIAAKKELASIRGANAD